MSGQKEQFEASANVRDALKDNRLRLPCWQDPLNQKGNLVGPLIRIFDSGISLAKAREKAERQETFVREHKRIRDAEDRLDRET